MFPDLKFFVPAALLALSLTSPAFAAPARNVILIVGDGMDDNQITIARNYLVGARGRLTIDNLPQRGSAQVLTVDESNPRFPVFVADSANSATSIATGAVTSMGRIATSAGDDQDLETIVEQAAAAGLRTGLVTTVSITGGTPAAFASHVANRGCATPAAMSSSRCRADAIAGGGPGSIAEQLALGKVDVLMGGGARYFKDKVSDDEHTVTELAQANGFSIVESLAELATLSPPKKVLGLFADNLMPVRLIGEKDRTAERIAVTDTEYPAPMHCVINPDFESVPPLSAMTAEAIRLLNNPKGFFLMVESGSVDKQSHMRRPCGAIGELEQLDEAVAVALEFAHSNGNTLIIVTADHGHSAQIIPAFNWFSNIGFHHTPGYYARLYTADGGVMGVAYATTTATLGETHTGVHVPVFANAAEDVELPTHLTQPDLFGIFRRYLRLD
jgi:alkaline phosphatase